MTTKELCALLGLELKPYQMFACLYLEQHGFRVCVDFGYENATAKAREHWCNRKRT